MLDKENETRANVFFGQVFSMITMINNIIKNRSIQITMK